jgi:hypothetical protein
VISRHRIFQFSIVSLLVLVGTAAQAQIFKCQENGKTVFRDKPCQGAGEKFNLGATIENTDPTGTLGDISGSWKENGQTIQIRDALGILDRKNSVMSLYLIPDRFTEKEVQHFQDTGDDSILKQKPAGVHSGFASYPFINLSIQFIKGKKRSRESIESAELLIYGSGSKSPQLVKLDTPQAIQSIGYISIFEDIGYGDVNLESEGDDALTAWKISVKAPLYYHSR